MNKCGSLPISAHFLTKTLCMYNSLWLEIYSLERVFTVTSLSICHAEVKLYMLFTYFRTQYIQSMQSNVFYVNDVALHVLLFLK